MKKEGLFKKEFPKAILTSMIQLTYYFLATTWFARIIHSSTMRCEIGDFRAGSRSIGHEYGESGYFNVWVGVESIIIRPCDKKKLLKNNPDAF